MPITATASSTWGSVAIDVNFSATANVWTVDVVRQQAGLADVTVRSGDAMVAPGGRAYVYDHEPPMGVSVTYLATGRNVQGASLVTATAALTTPTLSAIQCWVKSIENPAASRLVTWERLAPVTRPRRQQRFDVRGRSKAVIREDVISGYEGTLELVSISTADVTPMRTLLSYGLLLIQFAPAVNVADLYVMAGAPVEDPVGPRQGGNYRWSIPVVEVDRPSTVGSVLRLPYLSWDIVEDTWATWTALAAARTTWTDLLDG